ncbi:phage replisome organizer N-terminal domain-containing protein [Christensenella timonensis]|uniref:phage replisome organizer N-terminal domain-containing protein n=1 Tax=Christensenella timonensis TaxID=1816678 RepID=UPI0013904E09|nr:phage replisome organizer N-terminal domain-containing protein [Christensenella timonensis]
MGNPKTEAKRFFWLKLKEDFFDEKSVRYLRKLPQGDSIVIVYLKMLLKSLRDEGMIKYEKILPTATEELALYLDEPEAVVALSITAFLKMGLVEQWDNDTFYMAALQHMIGSESASAARMRKHREIQAQKRLLSQSDALVTQGDADVTVSDTEIELEIDQEKENIEEDEEARAREISEYYLPKHVYEHFADLFYKPNLAQRIRLNGFIESYGYDEVFEAIEETARRDVQKPLAYMEQLLKDYRLKYGADKK